MDRQADVDVLVIGGGPAGTTVASLVKKYTPAARVVVCERERFPRHHIGAASRTVSRPPICQLPRMTDR